jgi:predicted PurR-regulated permease PerM
VLLFFVLYPFIWVLALAGVLALIVKPLYYKLLRFLRFESLTSFIVIVILIVFIMLPLSFLGWQIFQEAQSMYFQVSSEKMPYLNEIAAAIEGPIRNYIPGFSINLPLYISNLFNWLVGNIGPIVSGTAQTLMNFLLVVISLFFFLKDGKKIRKMAVESSPLDDKYDNLIIEKLEATVNSVVRGTLLIAAVQGLIAGIGFWIFGSPNPALWGTIAAITSLIPGFGTGIVIVPVIIYLLVSGNILMAIGLSIWSALFVGSVDNLLRPFLYKKGVVTHPLFILFAVLGGLSFFGPIGLIFGPIVLSLFLTLLDIYKCFYNPNKNTCQ